MGLRDVQVELARRGGGIVAVSVDPVETNARVRAQRKLAFPILSDSERTFIRRLGLLHAHGGPGGSDIAVPAQFLIDRSGRVLWEHVARAVVDRVDPDETLARIRALPEE